MIKKLAEPRKLSKLKHVSEKMSLGSFEPNDEKGRTTEIIAPKIGISKSTLERALVVMDEADEENKKEIYTDSPCRSRSINNSIPPR